eukprot:scaffold66079_cov60-Phaeocystis_antarctica.AAC.3
MRRLRCLTNIDAASAATRQHIARPRQPSASPSTRLLVSSAPTLEVGGASRRRREPQSMQSVPNSQIDPTAFQPPSWHTPSPAVPQVFSRTHTPTLTLTRRGSTGSS